MFVWLYLVEAALVWGEWGLSEWWCGALWREGRVVLLYSLSETLLSFYLPSCVSICIAVLIGIAISVSSWGFDRFIYHRSSVALVVLNCYFIGQSEKKSDIFDKYLQEVLRLSNMTVYLLRFFKEMRNLIYFGIPDQINQNRPNPS